MYFVYWLATLHIARRLKTDDYCSLFQPRPIYDSDSMILWFGDRKFHRKKKKEEEEEEEKREYMHVYVVSFKS